MLYECFVFAGKPMFAVDYQGPLDIGGWPLKNSTTHNLDHVFTILFYICGQFGQRKVKAIDPI